ncbi:beta-N-acetylhexosaminidase [Streptomyces purpurascens]
MRLTQHSRLCAGTGTEGVGHGCAPPSGRPPACRSTRGGNPTTPGDDGIGLRLDPGMGPEEYRLVSDFSGVLVEGGSAAGVFWGAQTLRQLLGPDAYRRAPLSRDRAWPGRTSRSRTRPDSAGAA